VLILAIVPVAALNLLRDRGENSNKDQQDSGIIREDDQDVVAVDPEDEGNDRDKEPREPELDDDSAENDSKEESGETDPSDQSAENDPKEGQEAEDERSESNSDNNEQGAKDSKEEERKKSSEEKDQDVAVDKDPEESTKPENGDKENEEESPPESDGEDETIDWGDLEYSKAIDVFLEETEGNLTRRNLAKLSVIFYEQLSGNKAVAALEDTFEDTKNPWVLKAYNLKIIPETKNGKFDPDRRITREEGANTFYRALRALDRPYPNGDYELIAGDVESINTWAYEAVAFMDYYEILPRRESNKLDPGKEMTSGEIKALWNNTRQWMDSYDQFSENLKAPTGVFANENQGEATIGWEPVADAEYYYVYESLSNDGPFHIFNDQNGRPLKVYWDEDYSLKVTGLNEGQTYYYRVRSVVNGIRSAQSEVVQVTATASQTQDFEDYEQYLSNNHGSFQIGDQTVEFESIEITRGAEENSLNLRYYLNKENSTKLRGLIRDGYREDIRTLYGYIIRETSDFYEKDIKAYIIYEDFGLEEYPSQYQDNRIEPDPIGEDADGTYFVWFPYLEMFWDIENGEFTHRWFYRNEGA